MDKREFNIKVEQIKKRVNEGDYETAMKIADAIDWRRVRNTNLLSMVAQIYEKNGEYGEAKNILLLAFERAPIGKRLLYKLTDLALKENNIDEAEDYYREFCDLAPEDTRQHLLRYMILRAKGARRSSSSTPWSSIQRKNWMKNGCTSWLCSIIRPAGAVTVSACATGSCSCSESENMWTRPWS